VVSIGASHILVSRQNTFDVSRPLTEKNDNIKKTRFCPGSPGNSSQMQPIIRYGNISGAYAIMETTPIAVPVNSSVMSV
jgi:hypothetical protein